VRAARGCTGPLGAVTRADCGAWPTCFSFQREREGVLLFLAAALALVARAVVREVRTCVLALVFCAAFWALTAFFTVLLGAFFVGAAAFFFVVILYLTSGTDLDLGTCKPLTLNGGRA